MSYYNIGNTPKTYLITGVSFLSYLNIRDNPPLTYLNIRDTPKTNLNIWDTPQTFFINWETLQTYLITGADPPDSRLTHGDLSQPASDTLPLCPHGVAGLCPQPPPHGVALVHRPADTAGSHAEGEEQ